VVRLFRQDLGVGIGDFGAECCGHALGGPVDQLQLTGQVASGVRYSHYTEGGPVPDDAVVEFGYGEVEGVAEFVLEGTDDLPPVLQGLGVGDLDFEGQLAYGHDVVGVPPWGT
jgi:hypothetical protein